MELYYYAIALFGGILVGIINTLAGNGSTISLYILMDIFGLTPNIANATNRLGLVTQGIGSLPQFYSKGYLNFERSAGIVLVLTLGAIGGFIVALNVDDEQFKAVFKYMLLLMLGVILVKPERWLRKVETPRKLPFWIWIPVCLVLGFYGGFIQMGMGIFLLMFLVLGAQFNLTEANAIKTISVSCFTLLGVLVFAYYGWIDWRVGAMLAVGQGIGGYLGAWFSTSYPSAELWVYRLLVIEVTWGVLRLFGVIDWIWHLLFG